MSAAAAALAGPEAEVAARWAAGARPPLRLADGRALRVIFPGVPGPGRGPDFIGAAIEIAGDLVRGDVEIHALAAGWAAHGHGDDPAYAGVILHVVGDLRGAGAVTRHGRGRAIPILALPPQDGPPPAAIVPPCALRRAGQDAVAAALDRLAGRRLRAKAARVAPVAAAQGPGQALYALALEQLGGSANRAAFAALAAQLPLRALRERVTGAAVGPQRAFEAELRGAAARLVLQRAGMRPMASPEARVVAAARLCAALWPAGGPDWPTALTPAGALAALRAAGLSRALAVEVAVNAVLPVALASGLWPQNDALTAARALPSPGTYGKLRRLEGWLGGSPFRSALTLQGGIGLHADYCTKGFCGRCPLSSE